MMKLRAYQEKAIEATYQHCRTKSTNPVIVAPTGSGKTPIIAQICKDQVEQWDGRVLILSHVKELIEQTAEKLDLIAPDIDYGIYSAGLNRRDVDQPVIIAGIQSAYKRACELGRFNVILIDEAHRVPPSDDGMYQRFLKDAHVVNPSLRIVGLTATPFRMKGGWICTPEHYLNEICYEIGIKELIADGYLSPLITKSGKSHADTSSLHRRGGEFIASEVADLMDRDDLTKAACDEITSFTKDRKSCLIFASSVAHGKNIQEYLLAMFYDCRFIHGKTPSGERAKIIKDFKDQKFKYLVNVEVLTTGFDAPGIDCISLLRPTLSAGLYSQMVGRGFRIAPDKVNCLILDYGENVMRHGPVDNLIIKSAGNGQSGDAPTKICDQCQEIVSAGFTICPQCGNAFPPPERKQHDSQASTAGVLSGQYEDVELEVQETGYSIHVKEKKDGEVSKTLRIQYRTGIYESMSDFVCIGDHPSTYAKDKGRKWWEARSDCEYPATVDEALHLANAGCLKVTSSITVRYTAGQKYPKIIRYEVSDSVEFNEEEIPF